MTTGMTTTHSAPILTVVSPCFNSAGTLREMLDGLTSQTLSAADYEILVIDDGSSDETCQIAASYENVRLLKQDRQGPGAARNLGAQRARGGLILYLDSDLKVPPDLLQCHVDFHRRHPEVAATGGSVMPAEPYRLFSWALADHLCSWFNAHPSVEYKAQPEYLPSLNFCVKKEMLTRHGLLWQAGLNHTGEDVLFCHALRQKGLQLAFLPAAVVYHSDRRTLRGYLHHMYRWGHHAPTVRGSIPTLRYGFLFPRNRLKLLFTTPMIILGYTALIFSAWLRRMPLAVTLALPQIFLGRLAYAAGVWRSTAELARQGQRPGERQS